MGRKVDYTILRFYSPKPTAARKCLRLGFVLAMLASLFTNGAIAAGANAPSPTNDVANFGAVGDGITMNTKAIQSAINACPAGGLVWLHNGTFLSGTVILHSNMTFYIDTNAILLGSSSTNDYPVLTPAAKNDSQQSTLVLISAQGCTNVTITGGGTINGNGSYANYPTNYAGIRPSPICTELCSNITIQNLTITNSPGWNVVNIESDYVTINNVNISDAGLMPYRDGFDVCDCWHVIIENCTNINAGDDAIVLKTGCARGVNDFVATNCIVTGAAANGLKLGTASQGPFTNILFENCTLSNVANAAMDIESIDGGAITGLTFQNIQFSSCQNGIFMILGTRDPGVAPGSINGVTFQNITGSNIQASIGFAISGTETNGVTYGLNNLLFNNVNLAFVGNLKYIPTNPPEYAGQYPVNTMWNFLPAYGYYIRHATNVTFTNCSSLAKSPDSRPWLATTDVSGLTLLGPPLAAPLLNVPPSVVGFGSTGSGWTFNGGATATNDALTLTDGQANEARSAFFNVPQPVNSFQAQFYYQANGQANGATFVLQNAAAGLNAVGTAGTGLGYGGMLNSAAVEFNLNSGGMGMQVATSGATGSYTSTLPVNLANGDPIQVMLGYNGSSLLVNLIDTLNGTSYTTNFPVVAGGTSLAYVGFTGADGTSTSVQNISDFSFTPVNLQPTTPIISPGGGNFTNSITVSLTLPSNGPASQIYYTLNGTVPTTRSAVYSQPFILTQTTPVQALTMVPGFVSSPVAATVFTSIVSGFGGNGSGWTCNGGATVTNNVLKLTDGGSSEARSAFFNLPQVVSNFQAQFIYQATSVGKISLGDGATFVVQDAPAGVASVGNSGGGLGYVSIHSSAAIELYLDSGMGTRLITGGAGSGPGYISTLPVNLDSGDPIQVGLNYNGSSLVETLVDLTTAASFTTNYTVNIPLAVGGTNTALVGFTGGNGASVALQTISNFSFTIGSGGSTSQTMSSSLALTRLISVNAMQLSPVVAAPSSEFVVPPSELKLRVVSSTGQQFTLQFNGLDGQSYCVEMSTNLAGGSWTPVYTNVQTGGAFIYTDINATNASRFYRVRN